MDVAAGNEDAVAHAAIDDEVAADDDHGFADLFVALDADVLGNGDPCAGDSIRGGLGTLSACRSLEQNTRDGYRQERNQIATTESGSGVQGTQTIVLRGPRGIVTIEAERGPNAQDSYDGTNGDDAQIAGHDAKQTSDGYAWVEDDLFVKVSGDSFVTDADVKAIAEHVEAVR